MDIVSGSDRPVPPLHRLADELVADIMSMSDAEVLAEVEAEGLNAEDEASRVRALISAATGQAAKGRLKAARAAIDLAAGSTWGQVHQLPLRDRAAVLARFANDDAKLKSRLTMAARNGEGITENEMDDILANLRELGAIDEDGNPI
ncbi:hypothetical protein [Sphingomonas dokdonensis]|nr:hypothetical protein [Sphingomonas dokdonensis]